MKQLLSLFAIALIAFGCSNSTEPDTGGTASFKHTIPGVGSTFEYTYTNSTLDTTLKSVTEVVASGLELGGKKNVLRLETNFWNQKSTMYLAYEANGDISQMSDADTFWIRQPFESKQQFLLTFTENNTVGKSDYELSATPYKQNDLIIDGKTVKGFQIQQRVKETRYDANGEIIYAKVYNDELKTWSHDIGMFTHDTVSSGNMILVNYNLK
jgi:hypothetical protein